MADSDAVPDVVCPQCGGAHEAAACPLEARVQTTVGSREFLRSLGRYSPAPPPDPPLDRSRVQVIRVPVHPPVQLAFDVEEEKPTVGQARLAVA